MGLELSCFDKLTMATHCRYDPNIYWPSLMISAHWHAPVVLKPSHLHQCVGS